MSAKVRRVRGSVAAGGFGTALALALGQVGTGVSLLIVARTSGPQAYGSFAALYAIATLVAVLIDFGKTHEKTLDLAQGRNTGSFNDWLVKRSIVQFPAAAIAMALSNAVAGDRLPLICRAGISAQGLLIPLTFGCLAPVRALISPAVSAYLVAIGNIAGLLVLSVLWGLGVRPLYASGITLPASWILTAVLARWLTLRRGHHLNSETTSWRAAIKGSLSFGVWGAAVVLNGLDVALVGLISTDATAGYIGAVARWTQPLTLIIYAYSGYLFPRMAAATSNAEAKQLLGKARPAVAVAIAASLCLSLGAAKLVSAVLGPSFFGSVSILRMSSFALLPAFGNILLVAFLQARGRGGTTAAATGLATGIYLAAIPLALALGWPAGVPVAYGFSQLVLLALLVRQFLYSMDSVTARS